jgi:hypothetical protein
MYISEFFQSLEARFHKDDRQGELDCASLSMRGYVADMLALLRAGEPQPSLKGSLFSILANFAAHVLSHENCGLIVGISDAEKTAICFGNAEKALRFDVTSPVKRRVSERVGNRLRYFFQPRQRPEKPVGLIAVHDIGLNNLPMKTLVGAHTNGLDFTLLFDGEQDIVERKLRKLQRLQTFASKRPNVRTFKLGARTRWTVVVYA